jgi:uncharacterized protein (DUF305 family)
LRRRPRQIFLVAAALLGSVAGCRSGGMRPAQTPADQARADSGRAAYTHADVEFMQGMIAHHAQAVVMAAWAPTHGARADIRVLASRIDAAQRDEMAFMQNWLRDRHEAVPDPLAQHDMKSHDAGMGGMTGMPMAGMSGSAGLMPGMLNPAQLSTLETSKGSEFDRLFLTFMIQHHQGAVTMVNRLFSTPGAGRDEYVFRFASDVITDQTTEIERMRSMLSHLSGGPNP